MTQGPAICFAIEYRNKKPFAVRTIWGRVSDEWRKGELDATSPHRTATIANRTAALFAWLGRSHAQVLSTGEDGDSDIPLHIRAHLAVRATKLLTCASGVAFLRLPCFFSGPYDVKRVKGSGPRNDHHTFFSRWFTVDKAGVHRKDISKACILFCDAGQSTARIEKQLYSPQFPEGFRGVSSPQMLLQIIECLGSPLKRRPPAPQHRNKPPIWASKYLDRAIHCSRLRPPDTLMRLQMLPRGRLLDTEVNRAAYRDGGNSLRTDPCEMHHAADVVKCMSDHGDPVMPIVLLGAPGSGRTSILQQRCQELLSEVRDGQPMLLPVLVDLAGQEGSPEHLVLAALGIKDKDLIDVLDGTKITLAVFFDNLDRMPARRGSRPSKMAGDILDIRHQRGVKQLILTSTTSQWSDQYLVGGNAKVFEVQPLDLRAGGNAEQYVLQRVPEQAKRIMKAARKPAAPLTDVVRDPLYLSMLCDSCQERTAGVRLPQHDADLVGSWVSKRLASIDASSFRETWEQMLQGIAAAMVSNRTLDITPKDVRRHGTDISEGWQRSLDEACHCSILTSSAHPGRADTISFPNLYVRDYFASQWFINRLTDATTDDMLSLLHSTEWDRPFLMAIQQGIETPLFLKALTWLLDRDLDLFCGALHCALPEQRVTASRLVPNLAALARDPMSCDKACRALCILDTDNAEDAFCEYVNTCGAANMLKWQFVMHMSSDRRMRILDRFSQSDSEELRSAATATAMEHMPEPSTHLLDKTAAAHDNNLSWAAIRGLGKLGTHDAIKALANLVKKGNVVIKRGSDTEEYDYRGASMLQLLRIGTTHSYDAILGLLASDSNKFAIAACIAHAYPSLLSAAKLAAARAYIGHNDEKSATGSPEKTDCTKVTSLMGYYPPTSSVLPKTVRDAVIRALTLDMDKLFDSYNEKGAPAWELWYETREYWRRGRDSVDDVWNGLLKAANDPTCNAEQRQVILRTLAVWFPNRAIASIKGLLAGREPIDAAYCLEGLANRVAGLPFDVADDVIDLFLRLDPPDDDYLETCISKLPRTGQTAARLARLIRTCDRERLATLCAGDALWRHDAILDALNGRLQTERAPRSKRHIALRLANLRDAKGISYLTEALPQWARQVVDEKALLRSTEDRNYSGVTWGLFKLSHSAKRSDSELAHVLAHALAAVEEEDRSKLLGAAKANLSECARRELVTLVRKMTGRRYFDLL